MTRDDIIRMAREAGVIDRSPSVKVGPAMMHAIGLFAALVESAEREACAEVCVNQEWRAASDVTVAAERYAASECARAIRARGDKCHILPGA